ncbi:MAG: hypothetical protein AAF183_02120 [Pseudomonadota bacterium]
MLTCCDLKPGVDLAAFEGHLARFTEYMTAEGLCLGCGPLGHRQASSGLDTDEERQHSLFFLMDFRDRAQADAALAHIDALGLRNVPTHLEVFRQVANPIFICWADAPDARSGAGGAR